MGVVAVKVPPGPVVIGRRTPILNDHELGQVTKDVIDDRAVPVTALFVDSHALMRCTERVEHVDVETGAGLYDCARDESTLRDAEQVDLLVSVVRVVTQLVACNISLPLHPRELGRSLSIADFDTFDDGIFTNSFLDHVNPGSDRATTAINAMEQSNRSYSRGGLLNGRDIQKLGCRCQLSHGQKTLNELVVHISLYI